MDLADPHIYKAAGVDVALGADLYQSVITEELVVRGKGVPVAHTMFGRILSGVYMV